jgi:ATP-binding protein involved in chromosome partitioning
VRGVGVDAGKVAIELPGLATGRRLARGACRAGEGSVVAAEVPGVQAVTVGIARAVVAHRVQKKDLTPAAGSAQITRVASGMGGVGKSTTACNLALALVAEGARVGVLDATSTAPASR